MIVVGTLEHLATELRAARRHAMRLEMELRHRAKEELPADSTQRHEYLAVADLGKEAW